VGGEFAAWRSQVDVAFPRFKQRWPRVELHFWHGRPHEVDDLERVSVTHARHIIVLGASRDPRKADSLVISTLCSLRCLHFEQPHAYKHGERVAADAADAASAYSHTNAPVRALEVILEVSLPQNVRVAERLGGGGARTVTAKTAIDELLAIATLQPSVGHPLIELMTFEGAQIEFVAARRLLADVAADDVARTFGGLRSRLARGVLLGIVRDDADANATPRSRAFVERTGQWYNVRRLWKREDAARAHEQRVHRNLSRGRTTTNLDKYAAAATWSATAADRDSEFELSEDRTRDRTASMQFLSGMLARMFLAPSDDKPIEETDLLVVIANNFKDAHKIHKMTPVSRGGTKLLETPNRLMPSIRRQPTPHVTPPRDAAGSGNASQHASLAVATAPTAGDPSSDAASRGAAVCSGSAETSEQTPPAVVDAVNRLTAAGQGDSTTPSIGAFASRSSSESDVVGGEDVGACILMVGWMEGIRSVLDAFDRRFDRTLVRADGTRVIGTTGLKWRKVGHEHPTTGEALTNAALAAALLDKTEFSQEEWDKFGITDLHYSHFVKADGAYFKPDRRPLTIWMLSEKSIEWREKQLAADGLAVDGSVLKAHDKAKAHQIRHVRLKHIVGFATDEAALSRLPFDAATAAIVSSDVDEAEDVDTQITDSEVITSALLLRELYEAAHRDEQPSSSPVQPFPIVVEFNDVLTRRLFSRQPELLNASASGANDGDASATRPARGEQSGRSRLALPKRRAEFVYFHRNCARREANAMEIEAPLCRCAILIAHAVIAVAVACRP
jgi:hypothetical protein